MFDGGKIYRRCVFSCSNCVYTYTMEGKNVNKHKNCMLFFLLFHKCSFRCFVCAYENEFVCMYAGTNQTDFTPLVCARARERFVCVSAFSGVCVPLVRFSMASCSSCMDFSKNYDDFKGHFGAKGKISGKLLAATRK